MPAFGRCRFLGSALTLLVAGLGGCDPTQPPSAPPGEQPDVSVAAPSQASITRKLEHRLPLTPAEIDQLRGTSDERTLVLLMTNPGAPPELLRSFAAHPADAVRIAVASNPRTAADVLVSLRAPGVGRPINRALAMNPSTPLDVLRDMRAKGEAGDVSLASNPALPADLMEDIERRGDEVARAALARNPSWPHATRERLATEEPPAPRGAASTPR